VGDVHGELSLLQDLLARIEMDDLERGPAETKRLIFLGDLIDRGSASADVVSMLMKAQQVTKQLVVLMGNHEAALIESMDGNGAAQRMWLEHGGHSTLRSYSIEPPMEHETPDEFGERLRSSISAEVSGWLEKLPLTARSGSYFFCHAGIRPGVPLRWQRPQDLLWIRDEFLLSQSEHGAIVVHGHSICGSEVEFLHNRINVDTGAYETGVLSAVGLEGSERWVISAHGSAKRLAGAAKASAVLD
jgi:serine/threonine protein phosphatase 1